MIKASYMKSSVTTCHRLMCQVLLSASWDWWSISVSYKHYTFSGWWSWWWL